MSTPTRLYRALRVFVRAVLAVFYRSVEVTGREHLDNTAPTLLASNHPNSIIDPLLLGLFENRQISFCARHGLFKIPIMGTVLRAVGAIPIRRRSDSKDGKVDNAGAFDACRAVLHGEGVISIFPEGHTHNDLSVHNLKTGVARIAFDAALHPAEGQDTPQIKIVPVALNYLVRQAFRSDIHIALGPPIDVSDYLEQAREDERGAVRALTDELQEALRELAVHVEEKEDEQLVALVTSLVVAVRSEEGLDRGGQSPAERTALVKRVIDAYRWYVETEPEHAAELRRRLQHVIDERVRLGLGGKLPALQHRHDPARQAALKRRWRRRLAFFVLGAPVAIYGLVNTLVPYLVMRVVIAVGRPTPYRIALLKILGGTLVFGTCFAIQTWLVGHTTQLWVAVLYALTLLPISLFTLRYVTEVKLHRLGLRTALRRVFKGDRIAALQEERARLHEELKILRERYLEAHPVADATA